MSYMIKGTLMASPVRISKPLNSRDRNNLLSGLTKRSCIYRSSHTSF